MMNKYVGKWVYIIENMANENTYKLAWGRAIIEEIIKSPESDLTIDFKDIAYNMLRYYWNQTFFFNLKQGPGKEPIYVKITKELIEEYKESYNTTIPIWFDKYVANMKKTKECNIAFEKKILALAKVLKKDVSYRFKNVKKETVEVYNLDKDNMKVFFTLEEVKALKSYGYVISQLLNYRWAQVLEKCNTAPRIASKVRGMSQEKMRRNSLKKYKDILLKANNNQAIDFYTGKILEDNDISVDHVIPWSFMYSDNIWNLVLTSKSYNSSKSNTIPDNYIIEKLKQRNEQIQIHLTESKLYNELLEANENDYVSKFYNACKL